jgi:hypothetical protein
MPFSLQPVHKHRHSSDVSSAALLRTLVYNKDNNLLQQQAHAPQATAVCKITTTLITRY